MNVKYGKNDLAQQPRQKRGVSEVKAKNKEFILTKRQKIEVNKQEITIETSVPSVMCECVDE